MLARTEITASPACTSSECREPATPMPFGIVDRAKLLLLPREPASCCRAHSYLRTQLTTACLVKQGCPLSLCPLALVPLVCCLSGPCVPCFDQSEHLPLQVRAGNACSPGPSSAAVLSPCNPTWPTCCLQPASTWPVKLACKPSEAAHLDLVLRQPPRSCCSLVDIARNVLILWRPVSHLCVSLLQLCWHVCLRCRLRRQHCHVSAAACSCRTSQADSGRTM